MTDLRGAGRRSGREGDRARRQDGRTLAERRAVSRRPDRDEPNARHRRVRRTQKIPLASPALWRRSISAAPIHATRCCRSDARRTIDDGAQHQMLGVVAHRPRCRRRWDIGAETSRRAARPIRKLRPSLHLSVAQLTASSNSCSATGSDPRTSPCSRTVTAHRCATPIAQRRRNRRIYLPRDAAGAGSTSKLPQFTRLVGGALTFAGIVACASSRGQAMDDPARDRPGHVVVIGAVIAVIFVALPISSCAA